MADDDNIVPFPTFQRMELDLPERMRKLLVQDLYTLSGHQPVKVHSMAEWSAEFSRRHQLAATGHDPWRVAQTTVGDVSVSTVFLGLNHRHFGDGPPLLFETMTFGGALDQELQARCSTWEEAETMHQEAVRFVRGAHLKVVE